MKLQRSRAEQPLLQTVEEATALLRRCPARAWFWWCAGTAPFVCFAQHFWGDMSRSASAGSRLIGSALMLALAYGFMKTAHAVFGDQLLCGLRGADSPAPLPFRGKVRLVTSQFVIHCTAPWMLLLGFAATLPAGWVYAFYHHANIIALPVLRGGGRTRDIVREALAECRYRPGQNHALIALLLLFSILAWLNILAGCLIGAMLAKSFTGIENPFTRNPWLILSTSSLAAMAGASYLIAGPLVKACYAIRSFQARSRKSGEDIAVRFRIASGMAPFVLALGICLLPAAGLRAEAAAPAIDPARLDQSIHEVMQGDVFQWRMPRDAQHNFGAEDSRAVSFVRGVTDWVKSAMKHVGDFFEDVIVQRLRRWFHHPGPAHGEDSASGGSGSWMSLVGPVLYVLLAALAIALGFLLYRQWRTMPPAVAKAGATSPAIDLKDEEIMATQLPEDEWLRLAQEKIGAGEFRLALRALYLAALSHLGEHRLIAVARFKSNGDYLRELDLRARDRAGLRGTFRDQTRVFDRSWYGRHPVTRELLDSFQKNHQLIVADATR